jgi:hypothetical protein
MIESNEQRRRTMNTTDTTTAPNSSPRDRVTGTTFTRGLGVVILAGMILLVILGLFVSPPDVNQGESVRIMYALLLSPEFHRPHICGNAPDRSRGTALPAPRLKSVFCSWVSRSSLGVCGDELLGALTGLGMPVSPRPHSYSLHTLAT